MNDLDTRAAIIADKRERRARAMLRTRARTAARREKSARAFLDFAFGA